MVGKTFEKNDFLFKIAAPSAVDFFEFLKFLFRASLFAQRI
jgi:hypothetical protein